MPVGVIIDALSVVIGGLIGAVIANKVPGSFKENLNNIFGCCSITMGISSILLMEHMPAVVFSVIVGTGIGLIIHLGQWVNAGGRAMQKAITKVVKFNSKDITQEEFEATLLTVIVIFCASGTGIYGSIVAGVEADHSILIAKSVLDLFTALIFACTLGAVVCTIAIPQFIIFFILFLCAAFIPTEMINDFKACGGVLMLATGLRQMKVKMLPTADMIPAMIIVMPVAAFWVSYINPLVAALAG